MDTQNPSAPPHAQSRPAANKHPNRRHPDTGGGLIHDHTRHTTRFTVIGNHLTQHAELSLLAIGLGSHIQSLPPAASADIKSLAARFPEGPARIAAALRELEAHGFCAANGNAFPAAASSPARPTTQTRHPRPRPQHPYPTPPAPKSAPRAPRAVPHPAYPAPALLQQATDLLAGLRRLDSRLLLSAHDIGHLTPRRRRLAGTGRHPHRRTPRPDQRPPSRGPTTPRGPPGPPADRPVAATAAVPGAPATLTRPPPTPELRRLRPRLPGPGTRPLP